ncbi:MAG: hypothetical protein R3F48_17360 [Candidatus Zixiibacteriota bacterium]
MKQAKGNFPEPETGPIPEPLRLTNSPDFCSEELAIIHFVNGERTMEEFLNEIDQSFNNFSS